MKKKRIAKVILFILSGVFLFLGFYMVYPNVSKLKKVNPKKTSFMEYREREWAIEGKKTKITHSWVTLSDISPYLIKAVLIAEDDKFWSHEGFDIEGIERAIEKDIRKMKFKAGGSTISQQLAKNLYLTPSRNPVRKIKEAVLTWRIEKTLSKKRILELYLNVAEWGDGIFGIEAASRRYYGKPSSALSPEEASMLAAVLPNPRKYNPLRSSKYTENRSRVIYNIMVKRGIVVQEYEDVTADSETEGQGEKKSGPEHIPDSPIEETNQKERLTTDERR